MHNSPELNKMQISPGSEHKTQNGPGVYGKIEPVVFSPPGQRRADRRLDRAAEQKHGRLAARLERSKGP